MLGGLMAGRSGGGGPGGGRGGAFTVRGGGGRGEEEDSIPHNLTEPSLTREATVRWMRQTIL